MGAFKKHLPFTPLYSLYCLIGVFCNTGPGSWELSKTPMTHLLSTPEGLMGVFELTPKASWELLKNSYDTSLLLLIFATQPMAHGSSPELP